MLYRALLWNGGTPLSRAAQSPSRESRFASTTVALKRRHPRPSIGLLDKLFWVIARRVWSGWKQALLVVTPETVVRWHRGGTNVDLNALYFTAGYNNQKDGLFGEIQTTPEPGTIALVLSGLSCLGARRLLRRQKRQQAWDGTFPLPIRQANIVTNGNRNQIPHRHVIFVCCTGSRFLPSRVFLLHRSDDRIKAYSTTATFFGLG